MGRHSEEKPVGEGKKELAVSLAFCSSVGGGALTNIWHGCCLVASSPCHSGIIRKLEWVGAIGTVNFDRMLCRTI